MKQQYQLGQQQAQANAHLARSNDELRKLVKEQVDNNKKAEERKNRTKRDAPQLTEVSETKWRIFREDFETVARTNHWDPPRARSELMASIQGDAGNAVRSREDMVGFDPEAKTTHRDLQTGKKVHAVPPLIELLDLLQTTFVTQKSVEYHNKVLDQMKQETKESVHKYRQRVTETFKAARPQLVSMIGARLSDGSVYTINRDETYIRYFVRGLLPKISERVAEKFPKTIDQAYEYAKDIEAALYSTAEAANPSAKPRPYEANVSAVGLDGKEKGACYVCFDPNHLKRDCPYYKRLKEMERGNKRRGNGEGNSNSNSNSKRFKKGSFDKNKGGGAKGQPRQDKRQLNAMNKGEEDPAAEPAPATEATSAGNANGSGK